VKSSEEKFQEFLALHSKVRQPSSILTTI
jgi:hypothetical protein